MLSAISLVLSLIVILSVIPGWIVFLHNNHGIYLSTKKTDPVDRLKILLKYNNRNFRYWIWCTHILKSLFLNGLGMYAFNKSQEILQVSKVIEHRIEALSSQGEFSSVDDLGDVGVR